MVNPDKIKEAIRTRAHDFGFDVVGFTQAEAGAEDSGHLRQYLSEGRHGDMDWMARNAERRPDPQALWPRHELSSASVSITVPSAIRARCTGNRIAARSACTRAAATTTMY